MDKRTYSAASATEIDDVWTDLEGDIEVLTATGGPVDGPFTINVTVNVVADPFELPATDDAGLVGEPISVLLPWDAEPGHLDPWALPEIGMDWTGHPLYDPMTACADWSVADGWVDATAFGPIDSFGPSFDTAWLAEPGSYYDDSAFYSTPGYWDPSGYFEAADNAFVQPMPAFDATVPFDASTGFDPMADPTGTQDFIDNVIWDGGGTDTWDMWDTSSSWDTIGVEDTSVWDPSGAAWEGSQWDDVYNTSSDLSWDAYQNSVDAWLEGDYESAYNWQQESFAWEDTSNAAWDNSSAVWDDPGPYFDSSSSWDTGSDWSSWDTGSDW